MRDVDRQHRVRRLPDARPVEGVVGLLGLVEQAVDASLDTFTGHERRIITRELCEGGAGASDRQRASIAP